MVLFASNWAQDCDSGCGSPADIKDYVVWTPRPGDAGLPPPPDNGRGLRLQRIHPNPGGALVGIAYSLDDWRPARLELLDIAGRAVLTRSLGSPGPGFHDFSLGSSELKPGLYWVRLSQAGRSAAARVSIVR